MVDEEGEARLSKPLGGAKQKGQWASSFKDRLEPVGIKEKGKSENLEGMGAGKKKKKRGGLPRTAADMLNAIERGSSASFRSRFHDGEGEASRATKNRSPLGRNSTEEKGLRRNKRTRQYGLGINR